MEMDRLLILAIAVVAAASGPAQSPPASPESPSLSGLWRFNAEKSEDARQKMREARGRSQPGGGGPWGGPGGGPGGGGFGRHRGGTMGGRSGRPQGDPGAAMSTFFEASQELTVTQTESEIAVLEKDGRLRTIHPDGQKYKSEGGTSEVKAYWDKDQHLVVETKQGEDARMTETFSLPGDRSQLIVNLRFEGRFGPVAVRRVYDAAAPE